MPSNVEAAPKESERTSEGVSRTSSASMGGAGPRIYKALATPDVLGGVIRGLGREAGLDLGDDALHDARLNALPRAKRRGEGLITTAGFG